MVSRSIHENYKILMDDVEDIKDDFLYNFPRLKENGEELEELNILTFRYAYRHLSCLLLAPKRLF
jgi:hypothetical protein